MSKNLIIRFGLLFGTSRHAICAVKQTAAPKILFKQRVFVVGEYFIANCTTTRAKPVPHIQWLINGKKVKKQHNKRAALDGCKTKAKPSGNDKHTCCLKSSPFSTINHFSWNECHESLN